MDRKEQNKLLTLLLLLFLTVILFSTTSYAWFSANRMVSIDTLNIQVATVGGLDISADGTNWRTYLGYDNLIEVKTTTYLSNTNQFPLYLEPVSTGGNVDSNGYLEVFHGIASNSGIGNDFLLTTTRSMEDFGYGVLSNGKFVVFDIFLRTPSEKELYLTTESGVTFGGEETTGIENAFRIAFLDEGNVTSDSALSAIQGLNNATTAYIWEPNYDTHTTSGVENAYNVYGVNITEQYEERLDYDGVVDTITSADNISLQEANATNHALKFKTVDISYATPTNRTTYARAFTVRSGITKIRVYVWIEGQDVDCENEASVGNANLFLQLSINPA